MFGAMALIGYTTKKDLSSIGGFLTMALIGLIIAGLVNMFLRSTMFDLIISGVGVILFCGLTAWDMQWIKRALLEAPWQESYRFACRSWRSSVRSRSISTSSTSSSICSASWATDAIDAV